MGCLSTKIIHTTSCSGHCENFATREGPLSAVLAKCGAVAPGPRWCQVRCHAGRGRARGHPHGHPAQGHPHLAPRLLHTLVYVDHKFSNYLHLRRISIVDISIENREIKLHTYLVPRYSNEEHPKIHTFIQFYIVLYGIVCIKTPRSAENTILFMEIRKMKRGDLQPFHGGI